MGPADANMNSSLICPIILDYNNWRAWSAKLMPLLDFKDCLMTIKQCAKPEAVPDEHWRKSQKLATYIMKASICDELLFKIDELTSPFEIYKVLRDSFEGSGIDKSIKLVQRLHLMKSDFPGIADITPQAIKLKSEFVSHFDFTKDDFWVAYVLDSLPPEFQQIRLALKTKDKLTLDTLKNFLNQESDREMSGMIANVNVRKPCIHCNGTNHASERCYKKFGRPGSSKPDGKFQSRKNKNFNVSRDDQSNTSNERRQAGVKIGEETYGCLSYTKNSCIQAN
jgi:hypothetical protein